MSEEYQRVEPTPFDAPTQVNTPASRGQKPDAARPPWLLPALAVLAVLALTVVFVLPELVDNRLKQEARGAPDAATQETVAARPTQAAQQDSSNASSPSPFADAVEAKARSEAQELLAELLDVQELLVERGAETWAAEPMAAIAAQALAGDEHYREREFDAAISSYTNALTAALALEGSLPERFEEQTAAVINAVEALDLEAAREALGRAGQLDPDANELPGLQQRVDALPQVIEAVALAGQAEASAELAAAVKSMTVAADLDTEHRFVAAELARLQADLLEQRFNTAMSEGYAALDERNFSRAQDRFERARKLAPGSAEVTSAIAELATTRTAAKLNALQRQGEQLLADEDWAGASATFGEALAIDASLRFAREGLAVAEPRAALQKQLTAVIDDPARLVDDAVLREARRSLADSQALDNIGPKLGAQITRAAEILRIASTPVDVRLRSDGKTAVTVYKVARLGSFEQQVLSLRPGQYTAVGTRRGYRDVRVTFEVRPAGIDPVYIACSEVI